MSDVGIGLGRWSPVPLGLGACALALLVSFAPAASSTHLEQRLAEAEEAAAVVGKEAEGGLKSVACTQPEIVRGFYR